MTTNAVASTPKILVAYRTKLVDYHKAITPKFEGRAGTKDPVKIAEQIAEKEARFQAEAASMPYTSTFDEVRLILLPQKETLMYKSEGRGLMSQRPPISVVMRGMLLKAFPNAWGDSLGVKRDPPVMFVGFNPRRFLKIFGLECSLPGYKPLPLDMWYASNNYRDIEETLLPSQDCGGLSWSSVVETHRLHQKDEEQEKFERLFAGWQGPGHDTAQDLKILAYFAVCLDLVKSPEQ